MTNNESSVRIIIRDNNSNGGFFVSEKIFDGAVADSTALFEEK